MNVSTEPVDIQSIVYKENGEIPDSGCDLWWWNNNLPGGDMGYQYAQWNCWWYDPTDESLAADDYYGEGPCWTDDNEEEPALIKKTFVPGEGFYAQPNGGATKPTLTIAGAVFGAEDSTSESRSIDFLAANKKQLCNNPFPVAVNIQDIIYMENGEIPDSGCDLWWWDNDLPGGDMGYLYAQWNCWWYDPTDESLAADDYYGEGPCWTDDNEEEPALIKKTFAPGVGFYVQPNGGANKPKLFFPNPFLKK